MYKVISKPPGRLGMKIFNLDLAGPWGVIDGRVWGQTSLFPGVVPPEVPERSPKLFIWREHYPPIIH